MTNPPHSWSQSFEITLHPAIASFNSSISFDIALIEYDITGSQAHAKRLEELVKLKRSSVGAGE